MSGLIGSSSSGGRRPSDHLRAARREVEASLTIPEPEQPGEKEIGWIAAGLIAVAALALIHFMFGGGLAGVYFIGLMCVVGGLIVILPGSKKAKVARIVGLAIAATIAAGLLATGAPLALMDGLSPVAQNLQGNSNGVNNGGNLAVLVFVIITTVISLVLLAGMWIAKQPWVIIACGVLLPFSLIFFLGMASQAGIHDM